MTASVTSCATDAAAQALDRYLRMLAGPAPGARLLEIRFALRHRDMGRLFIAAHSASGAARLIRRLGARTDVYVGVCLRSRRAGGRDAIDRAHLAFVEIDHPDAIDRLAAFHAPPTMTVASGGPGHAHAYFALSTPVSVLELEWLNRRLAEALGGDLASVDAARILRPVGTRNHKYSPPGPVDLVEHDLLRHYQPAELVGELPAPSPRPLPAGPTGRRVARAEADRLLFAVATEYVRVLPGFTPNRSGKVQCPFHGLSVGQATAGAVTPVRSLADASLGGRVPVDPLLLVPPPVYFERLTGVRVGRSGKLRCFFHDDRVPSLHVYPEASRGWYCFGC